MALRYLVTPLAVKFGHPLRKPLRMALSRVDIRGLHRDWWANFMLLALVRIMYNYIRKKMISRLSVSGNVWGGSTSLDVLAVHNYDPKKKTYSFSEISIVDIQEHPLGVYLEKESLYFNIM